MTGTVDQIETLIRDWRRRAQKCREAAGKLGHNEYAAMWNRQKATILTECADELAAIWQPSARL